ncbi:MAG: efflux transporter outer membrane subunit [Alphaproteobacteria bacterium]|nr:efflux transporter outer membrane subunit [Alphaproteobacteria bacterium]
MRKTLLSTVAAILLAGCADVPPPQLPAGDIPKAFEQADGKNAPLWPARDWWNGFGDAQLSALMTAAEAGNLDIAQAVARLRQADARAKQAGAPLLPSLGLNANVNTLYGQAKGASLHETDWGAALGASYELDFWGKNRDALQSAEAARAASAADRATVGLTVSAGIADTYFQLLSLRERMDIARANLAASEETLRVVQRRVDAGYAATSDLAQERANMAAQRAILPGLAQQELETRNALALLLGRPPEGLAVTGASLTGLSGPAVTPGLPSELLARRPDVMAAEANLAAAHADLAAARTAFLPDITLTANGGVAYPALAAAIDTLPGTGLAAGIGASLVQSIFDNGKIQGRIDETKAREEELLAAYRAAAIAAFSDVENALGNIAHLADQEAALREQVAQAEKVLAAARRKYGAGYADFLVVTDAERTLNTARDQRADIHRARLVALVTLYKALGGGWTRTAANAP